MTADFSGANPVVYAVTTEADNNQIVRFSDTGRGLHRHGRGLCRRQSELPRHPPGTGARRALAQPLLSLTPAPGAVILNWSGSFFLQSATNVTGPYTDVTNTAPYTNSTSGAQMFFRLRQ